VATSRRQHPPKSALPSVRWLALARVTTPAGNASDSPLARRLEPVTSVGSQDLGPGATIPARPDAASSARRLATDAAQRIRILDAMVDVVAERGFRATSVRQVTARARVSTRTFYQLFPSVEDCFMAVLDLGVERAAPLITGAFDRNERWEDGVRDALAALLVYFDSEPVLARVWFVEAMAAGSWALERRERDNALLRALIVAQWEVRGNEPPDALTAAGVMASVFGLIHTHLLADDPRPLISLLGPMMGLIMAPFLDTNAVEQEIARGNMLARMSAAETDTRSLPATPSRSSHTADQATYDRPSIALDRRLGRRASECLLLLAEHPGCSNRELATALGITHGSQVSRLLSHLLSERLATKRSGGVGRPNAWTLTPRGEELLPEISQD